MAEVMRCDICSRVDKKEHFHQVGFNLKSEIGTSLFGISAHKNVPQDTRDLCNACYSDLINHFKDNPIPDPDKCPHGVDWDDCPDCRH